MSSDSAGIALSPGAPAHDLPLTAFARSLEPVATPLVALVVFVVGVWAFHPYPVGIFHDDGVYLILARALATGRGYRYLHIPGAPVATHYPPGYPLVLAGLLRLTPDFPRNVELLLLVNAALLAIVAWGVDHFARRRCGWSRPASALTAVASTLSLPLLTLGGTLMSELLFLALLFPVLGVIEDGARSDDVSPQRALLLGAAAGALTLVCVFALPIGLVLILALARRRRWRLALCALAGMTITLAPWLVWVAVHDAAIPEALRGSYGSYGTWYGDGLRRMGARLVTGAIRLNLSELSWLLADRVAPWRLAPLRDGGLAAAIGLSLLGLYHLAQRARILVGFAIAYVLITLVFPWSPWRYLWALWPVVLLSIGAGMQLLMTSAYPTPRPLRTGVRVAVAACIGFVVAGILRAEWLTYAGRAWEQPARDAAAQIAPLVRWTIRNTRPGDVLLADDEPLVYLYTGRQALPPIETTSTEYVAPRNAARDAAAVRSLIDRYHVRYAATVVPSTYQLIRELAAGTDSSLGALERFPGGGGAFVVRRP